MPTRSIFEALPFPLLAALVVGASACAPAAPDSHASSHAALGETAPVLGSANGFAVLGGSTVTNTGSTTVRGDLGVSPGLAITGFPPGLVIGGATHAGDALALQAQTDTGTAYDALRAEACNVDLTGQDLGGMTLVPGVYCFSSSAQLTGALVLDAGGRADAVFVFKIASTLTTASNASVRVINGGNECGVFWQVGSSATLGTTTVFAGSIFALASITLTTGATVSGRALARTGAVTMDTNAVSLPICGAVSGDAGVIDAAQPDSGLLPPDAAPPPVDAGVTHDANTDAGMTQDAGTGDAACCNDTMCGSACVDLSSDCSNCGACGNACASGQACSLGVCH